MIEAGVNALVGNSRGGGGRGAGEGLVGDISFSLKNISS